VACRRHRQTCTVQDGDKCLGLNHHHIAKTGLLLSRGREDFSDFESSVLRLKSTHVADCKPQAPPGRRWDFALELGYGRFLQIKLGPAKSLALESGPRATFGKKHEFKIL
jgi:hypothetical protein